MLRSGAARMRSSNLLHRMRSPWRLEAWGRQVGCTRLAHRSGAISGKPEIACRPHPSRRAHAKHAPPQDEGGTKTPHASIRAECALGSLQGSILISFSLAMFTHFLISFSTVVDSASGEPPAGSMPSWLKLSLT